MKLLLPVLLSATVFFVVYLLISTQRCLKQTGQLPKSISMTFYNVPVWLFVAFLLYSCGTISFINLTLKPESFILSNLGAWLLAGVGFMSNIKNKTVLKFHMFGALLGFAIILIGFWVDYSMAYITISAAVLIAIAAVLFWKKHYITWAIEIIAIACMLIGYYILVFSCVGQST
nr:hypothetical protein [uncultured Draconibacterium sp.]